MGRWLARLQQEEKNVNPPGDETLKTFETPSNEVLRVSKASHPGENERFADALNIGDDGGPKVSTRSEAAAHAGRFEDRPANWMPEPGPGVTILRPAVEVPAAEYDRHLDTMIAALPAGSPEAYRLSYAKKKGWCVDRGGERIFTRGRF